jgi:DnaJ-class molecular chaperone
MAEDHYETLGVPRTASAEDIRKAYRELARKYHPDLHPDDAAAKEKFKKVQTAFDVLNDQSKREMYDRYGSSFEGVGAGGPGGGWGGGRGPFPGGGFPGGGGAEIDLESLFGGGGGFGDLFGGGGGTRSRGRRRAARAAGEDVTARIDIRRAPHVYTVIFKLENVDGCRRGGRCCHGSDGGCRGLFRKHTCLACWPRPGPRTRLWAGTRKADRIEWGLSVSGSASFLRLNV